MKGRPQLARGEGVEGAEAGGEFGGGQLGVTAGGRALIPKNTLGGPCLWVCFCKGGVLSG